MKRVRFAVLAFVLACGLGFALLWSGLLSGPLLRAAAAEVETRTGYKLEVDGAARIALFPAPAVVAQGVRVSAPASSGGNEVVRAERVSVGLSLPELLRGRIHATDIGLRAPVFHLASGQAQPEPRKAQTDAAPPSFAFDAFTIENGTLVYRDAAENVEFKVEAIEASARAEAENGPVDLELRGTAGGKPVALQAKLGSLAAVLGESATALDATLRDGASGDVLLSAKAQMKLEGSRLALDALEGAAGRGRFRGSANIDWSRPKPYLQSELTVEGVSVSVPGLPSGAAGQPWDARNFDLSALRLANAAVKLAARNLLVGSVKVPSAQVDASLLDGVLSVAMGDASLYGGKGQGRMTVDASSNPPRESLRATLFGLDALPLFTDALGLSNINGKIQATVLLQTAGASPAAIARGLDGTAKVRFENGAITGLGIEDTIRALPAPLVQGWALSTPERIPFGSFGMTFSVAEGQAKTDDLALDGPYMRATGRGTADIGAKTLDFAVDPTVLFPDRGTRPTGSLHLGIPVLIQGSWNDPKVSAPVERLLQNPDGAIRTLQSLGEGLLSGKGGGSKPRGDTGRGDSARDLGLAPPAGARDQLQGIMKNLFGN